MRILFQKKYLIIQNILSGFEWSDDSTKIVLSKGFLTNKAEESIDILDANGNILKTFPNTGFYPRRLSPDNKKIAYYTYKGLFIIDTETNEITKLASEESGLLGLKIDWSKDGKKIFYQSYLTLGNNNYINVFDLETMTYKNIFQGGFLVEYNDSLDKIVLINYKVK